MKFSGSILLTLALAACLAPPVHAQTLSHEADLAYSDSSCTTAKPCLPIQVYRAQCASATSCPSFATSPNSFVALPTATKSDGSYTVSVVTNSGGSNWTVIDKDPAMLDGTTYEWVSTVSYPTSAPSGASNPFQGTTNSAATTPPGAPSGQGKIIQ